ncbi:hypothetical protein FHW17_001540 [Phyllobacterium sp. P30BS-XVII]|nr:hypothetical protein [Phyllobacterium sp. P30BS-XVII]
MGENPSRFAFEDLGSWFNKLTMRESEDATLIAEIAVQRVQNKAPFHPPKPLMVVMSNHEPLRAHNSSQVSPPSVLSDYRGEPRVSPR